MKTWIVTTSPDRPIKQIANDLTDVGFNVGQVLNEIGVIIGMAAEDAVKKARSIAGIVDMSPDMPIDIGPPGWTETP